MKTKRADFTHVGIWIETRRAYRVIAAATDKSIVQVMHDLAVAEIERLGIDKAPFAISEED